LNSWLPAAQYTELGLSPAQPAVAGAPPGFAASNPTAIMAVANLERRVKSGAGWFFFVGAFSLINSLVLMSGNAWQFLIGLAVTQLITIFSSNLGNGGMMVGLLLNLAVLAVFVVFGIFARKGHSWSFIAGMVCYAADGALFVVLGAQMGNVVFHGIALVFMFLGLQANLKLKAMRKGAIA